MAEKKEKQYVSDNAQLMAEWDWEKNTEMGIDPNRITYGSTKKVNWLCNAGHSYTARVDHRTIMKSSCPYCAHKVPILGETDLATTHPELLLEWDYEHNEQPPEHFLPGSNKKVGWICPQCDCHWETQIIARTMKNTGCPVCKRVQRGKTRKQRTIERRGSLAKELPELTAEWDYEKNGNVIPSNVHASSKEIVWWKAACGHSWQASIQNRVSGNGCPVCAGKIVLVGFNDLSSQYPEISCQWHPDLNNGLLPNQVTVHSDHKVWWLCPECAEAYYTSIYSRTSLRTGCPVCANKKIVVGKNDLATTHPDLAKEWHPSKNDKLRPADVVVGSNRKVWWRCEKGHSWQTTPNARKSGTGCPICAKEKRPINRQKTYLRNNGSLADNYPVIAEQWHPTLNADLTPYQVTSGSSALVWWICEKGHEWESVVYSRVAGSGCPYCNNEHNSSYPEQILFYYLSQVTNAINRYKLLGREIDIYLPKLNIGIEYNGRYYHQNREKQDNDKYQFLREQGIRVIVIREGNEMLVNGDAVHYQYLNSDYLNFDFVVSTVFNLCKLPICDINIPRDRTRIYEQYMLMEKANSIAERYPWLIGEWDCERNGKLTPWQISYGSNKRIHWICKKCGYRWEAAAHSRKENGCPCCANRIAVKGINDLFTTHPHLIQEWDYAKNDKNPETVVAGSHQYAWWICQHGHSWRAQVRRRAQGTVCPVCKKKK